MKKLYKPDIETILKPLLKQGTNNGQKTEREWLNGMLPALADHLKRYPKQYRSYGPYWWLLKQAMLAHGIDDFGDFIDAEWFEKATYNDEVLDVVACFVYSDYAVANGLVYSHYHHVTYIHDDGEEEEDQYILVDDEMEELIV